MANQSNKNQKKSSKKGLIGVLVGLIVVAGAAFGIMMMMNSGSKTATQPTTNPSTPTPQQPDTPTTQLSDEVIERNEKRKDDLLTLKEAVAKYQEDHDGELPGSESIQWNTMIRNYITGGVKDGATEEAYRVAGVCRFGENCVNVDSMDWEKNAHQIYVLLNATCNGEKRSNVIVSSTKKRQVAIFTILEGSETFLCVTN